LRIKEVAEGNLAKRSEAFYPLLYAANEVSVVGEGTPLFFQ